MNACIRIAECSLPYAKVMQTSAMNACIHIAECSLPYAKVMFFPYSRKAFVIFR